MENQIDQLRGKDAGSAASHDDALINKLALEMAGAKTNAMDTFEKAPESAFARYGTVTVNGLAKVPQGILNAVENDIKHPMAALQTIGMGAGMAVALKTILPEGGPAGAIAGLAMGAYFTYKSAEPIIDAYKKAGMATTMKELNLASTQLGNAGGTLVVDSALGAAGYKLGSVAAGRVLAMPALEGFNQAKAGFYDNMTNRLVDALNISPTGPVEPLPRAHALGVIPPYMLEELAARHPGNGDFLSTRNKTIELEGKTDGVRPLSQKDFNGAREVYDANGQEIQPGDKVRFEGEKASGNVEADRAYDYTGEIRDFYKKEFGRNSIDGKGMKMVSTVNYGQNFENAFWDGKQMTYGRPGPDSPFKTFVLRDIAGHEITHGVTEMEANTQYHGQSGALNESYSDVFGALIDQYAKGQTADKASWLTGEGIWRDGINGRALRDMANPGTAYDDPAVGKDPQPAHMKDYVKTWGDNGGVHLNSGIPNKAFAEFAKAVGGNAWEDPGHIWYEARRAAGSNPSFGSFAYQTLEAAKSLGKTAELPKLEAAWKTVGVTPDLNAVDTLTPGRGSSGASEAAILGLGKTAAAAAATIGSVDWIKSLLNKAS